MWFLIGFVLAILIFTLMLLIRRHSLIVRWYEWLITSTGIVMLLFTIQNVKGALGTNWETTPWKFLLVFGIPAVILLVIAVLLPWLRYRRTRR